MKVMVSACLMGENCKYSGGNNRNNKVLNYIKNCEVISVCPEVAGGLPVPRKPSEIVNGIVTNNEGLSVDKEFRRGADLCAALAEQEKPDLIILQPRSPSCGVYQIYDGTFSGTKIPGSGIFAEKVLKMGFKVIEPDDLAKL